MLLANGCDIHHANAYMRIRMSAQAILCGTALESAERRTYWRDVPNDLSSRIQKARRLLGLNQSQFGERLGVNQATVSRWEKGSIPDGLTLHRIAELAGEDVKSFTLADHEAGQGGPTLFIKGEVAAGVWREAWEWEREDWQPFQGGSHVSAPLNARFGLRVIGDSMNDVYPPGTLLDCVSCIHAGIDTFENGQRVIVIRNRMHGEVEATVKEYLATDDGVWLVPRSSNPAFQQPIALHGEEDPDIEETRIVAVVKGSYRPE